MNAMRKFGKEMKIVTVIFILLVFPLAFSGPVLGKTAYKINMDEMKEPPPEEKEEVVLESDDVEDSNEMTEESQPDIKNNPSEQKELMIETEKTVVEESDHEQTGEESVVSSEEKRMEEMPKKTDVGGKVQVIKTDAVVLDETDQPWINTGEKNEMRIIRLKSEKKHHDMMLKPLFEDMPDWKARWELARLMSYTGRYDDAVFYFRQVMKEKPKLFEVREECARALYWNGEVEKARQMMDTVPDKEIKNESLIIMGELFLKDKDYAKASSYYHKYLNDHPDDHDVRLRLAEVQALNGEYEASAANYEVVVKARPENDRIRRQYAKVLSLAEKYDNAIKEFEKTLP